MKNKPDMLLLGQGLGTVGLVILLGLLLTSARPWLPLLDNANLMIHESGHIFFSTLGEFWSILGGSLMQVLVPIGVGAYFWYSKQYFAVAFCLFWLGESTINVSIYIKDARTTLLPLVNNGIHDWNWILGKLNMLNYDQVIGNTVYFVGVIACIAGVILAGYVFYKNSRKVKNAGISV